MSHSEADPADRAGGRLVARARLAALTLGCFLAALAGIAWASEAGGIATLWPANAILLAVLLRAPSRRTTRDMAGFAGAILAANLVHGESLPFAAGLAAANLCEVAVAHGLIARFAPSARRLDSLRHGAALLLLAGLAAPLVGASLGAFAVAVSGESPLPLASLLEVWLAWWAADATGMAAVLPFGLLVGGQWLGRYRRPRYLLTTAAVLAAALVLVQFALTEAEILAPLLILPVLVAAASLLDRLGTAVAILLAAFVAVLMVSQFNPAGSPSVILEFQVLIGLLVITGMMVSLALAERESALARLAESERDYRTLYEKSPVMLHSVDTSGRLVAVSDAWLEVLGYPRDEVLGRPLGDFMTEDSGRRAIEVNLPTLIRDGVVRDLEYQLVAKDGRRIEILLSAILRDGKSVPGRERGSRSIAFVTDVTLRKLAEARLAETLAELERSNRDLQEFADMASHDLQEPLRMVSSFTELLQRRYQGRLDAEADEYIDFARDGALRMRRMIEGLLTFSRAGVTTSESPRSESGAAVEAACADLAMAIAESGATIRYESLPAVAVETSRLEQLFQNLIGNALKYRRQDRAPEVRIEAGREDALWRFTVADNGIGVDPRHREQIFKMFKRLHGRQEYEGSGIGLAVCKRIVERHGGEIRVEEKAGGGSRFLFTLPAALATALATADPEDEVAARPPESA